MMDRKTRYLALDVFRGATVGLMILVNTPGEWGVQYGPLQHAPWHGFTLTDLVFPSFLFAVGNAMAFVMDKFRLQTTSFFWRKLLKRVGLIFLIGFLLNWYPFYDFEAGDFISVSSVRVMGVLQRIALCYGLAGVLLYYGSRQLVVIISATTLIGYWAVLYLFGDPSDPYSLTGFFGNTVDRLTIGDKRLYHGEGVPFDPEGLLSTMPAVINVIFGYYTGLFIRENGHSRSTIYRLLVAGLAFIVVALVWDLVFPINKKIWTSSYVLLTSGIDIVILAALVYVIEVMHFRGWTYFFEVFGRNPLFIYALSWVLISTFYLIPAGESTLPGAAYDFLKGFAAPAHASFLFAVLYTLINWLFGYFMDKKQLYIKV